MFSDPGSIVVCGDQPDMIRRALEIGVSCIIVCQAEVDPELLAMQTDTCIISTAYDAYRAVRLIYHAMPISSICKNKDLVCFHLDDYIDDVQNPGNLGTIIRLADWFGITDIVCSEASADCFNPKVVQATMGAILRVRVHYTDLAALLSKAAALGLPVCGTFLEGANIYETELKPAGIVVMGNEGRGITDAVARTVTQKLFIPPWPADRRGSESLNVAMATGIVCGEFRRQASAKAGK